MKSKTRELFVIITLLNVFLSPFVYGGIVSKVEDNRYLYDYANIVKKNSELIEKFLKDYYDKTGIEFIILTINNLGSLNIDEYSTQIFNEWKVGMKNDGKGILLLISKDDRLIKFKISYKLEGVIKYEFCEKIVEEQIVPYIDQGQLYIGIQGAIEGIINETWHKIDEGILEIKKEGDIIERKEIINQEVVSEIGGYERYLEMLGEEPRSATDRIVFLHKEQRSYFTGQNTPDQALMIFTQILENKITDPFLDVYTDGTKIMLYYAPSNSFQTENFYRMIKDGEPYTVKTKGNRAVVLFRQEAKKSGPIFLTEENGKWRIDLVWTNQIIVYDFQNNWQYRDCESPYLFAFDKDYMVPFDGYPLVNNYHAMYNAPVPNLFERIQKLRDFIDLEPDNYLGYSELADIYSKECFLIDIAINLYKKAQALAPNEPSLYSGLGCLYAHSLKYDQAVNQYKKYIKLQPPNKYNYQRVADIYYFYLKDYESAISYYQGAIEVAPNDDYSKKKIIRSLAELGRLDEARKQLSLLKGQITADSFQKLEEYISKRAK